MPSLFSRKPKMEHLGSSEEVAPGAASLRIISLTVPTGGGIGVTLGNMKSGIGVCVISVEVGGTAAAARLTAGDVIVRINSHTVGAHAEALALITNAANGRLELAVDGTASVDEMAAVPPTQRSTSATNLRP